MRLEQGADAFPVDAEVSGMQDEAGLESLYLSHAPQAIRLAFLLTGDGELARDLVQEAFVRVAGRIPRLRRQDAFGAYLRTTVVNLAASRTRSRRREQAALSRLALERQDRDEPDLDLRAHLRTALRRLPPRQRAALVLRYFEDLPEREVARILGCSVVAARSLVARGMEGLRPWIEDRA